MFNKVEFWATVAAFAFIAIWCLSIVYLVLAVKNYESPTKNITCISGYQFYDNKQIIDVRGYGVLCNK